MPPWTCATSSLESVRSVTFFTSSRTRRVFFLFTLGPRPSSGDAVARGTALLLCDDLGVFVVQDNELRCAVTSAEDAVQLRRVEHAKRLPPHPRNPSPLLR